MPKKSKILFTVVGEQIWDAINNPKIKIILLPGGTRSSKTYSIMQCIYLYMCSNMNVRVTAWRAYQTWVRPSILYDWDNKFLLKCGLINQFTSTKTPTFYRHNQTNSTLEFSGLDNVQKVHGVASDLIWINEAMESERESVRQLLQRAEGEPKLILDYNPSEEEHYVYDFEKRDDCVTIHSTYLDNPFLSDSTIREIESYKDTPFNRSQGTVSDYHWSVYGLGLAHKKEGLIYTYEVIPEYPREADFLGYGLDFGFYPDPAACAKVGFFDGRIVVDELFYEQNLNNVRIVERPEYPSIQQHFEDNNIYRRDDIIADSAAKTSINELKTAGYNVYGVNKYPGSVADGIKLLQQYCPILVTEKSMNLIKELKNYTWQKDILSDKITNKPIDKHNHLLDLVRYVTQTKKVAPKYKGSKLKTITFD